MKVVVNKDAKGKVWLTEYHFTVFGHCFELRNAGRAHCLVHEGCFRWYVLLRPWWSFITVKTF